MKAIFKNYLFNHSILVCEEKAALDVAFGARYLLDKAYGIRITEGKSLVTEEMVPYVAEMLGKDVPEPFYTGFPDSVKKLSPDELLLDQLFHYIRTYGLGDFSQAGHSVLEEEIERKAFNEKCDAKDFVVLSEAEAVSKLAEYIELLLAGTRPLNVIQFEFVCEYIREYNYIVENCASKNLAIKLLLEFRDEEYARFLMMSDVIKLVDELNFLEYDNKDIKKLNLKNQDRKFITKVMNRLFHADSCDIRNCYEKKAVWSGLLHHIHYKPFDEISAQFVQGMRGKTNFSVYSEFEQALAQKDIQAAVKVLKSGKGSGAILRHLNYILSRCETQEEIDFVTSQISSTNGLVLMQLLMEYSRYNEQRDGRIFQFTKHNLLTVHKETEEEQERRKSVISEDTAKRLCEAVEKNLQDIYKGKLGKVYIDPAMKRIALPMQETTSSGGYGVLPKGTKIHMEEGKKIRAFTYWEKVDDIDLSVIGIGKDGRQEEFSWRTMHGNQSDAIVYSGDQTAGYNGGSEYFDIDIRKFKELNPDITHMVFCNNVFSYMNFSECVCRAGYMLRENEESGEIFEPKTVKSSFTINGESTFAYLFAIDLNQNDFIWLNLTRDSRVHVAGTTGMDFLTRYFDVTEVMNFEKFFTMLATDVVENPEEAEVIVTDGNITVPEGAEVIRSYDFERVMALMNA